MGYKKIESLRDLQRMQLNVHAWAVPESLQQFRDIVKKFNFYCTVRTDSLCATYCLPFYEILEEDEATLLHIWMQSIENNYKLIVANGRRADDSMWYNASARIEKNGDFEIEFSKRRVPQRKMFEHKTSSISGNLLCTIQSWRKDSWLAEVSTVDLRRELSFLYSLGIYGKWIEFTTYTEPVGELQQERAFWQVQR